MGRNDGLRNFFFIRFNLEMCLVTFLMSYLILGSVCVLCYPHTNLSMGYSIHVDRYDLKWGGREVDGREG